MDDRTENAARAEGSLTILVTGATGLLGGHLVAELARRGDRVVACGGPGRERHGLDLCDRAGVFELVARVRPDVVIHAAALSAMSDCVRAPDLARRINVEGTSLLGQAASASSARLVHVSTDLVFDGEKAPYTEDAVTAPTSVYGRTKRDAELEASKAPRSVVVRVSLLFGPTRDDCGSLGRSPKFFDQQIETLKRGAPLTLFDDEWRTPLSLRAAAECLVAIARSDVEGTLHLGGPERMSRYEMGVRLARSIGCSAENIVRASRLSLSGGEPRPRDVSLDSSRFVGLFPTLAMGSFEEECLRMGTGI